MEIWLFVIITLAIATAIFLWTKQAVSGVKNNASNKVLLKQLLEGFGLEVPDELKNLEDVAVKSLKSH